jgi:hypothetical protein
MIYLAKIRSYDNLFFARNDNIGKISKVRVPAVEGGGGIVGRGIVLLQGGGDAVSRAVALRIATVQLLVSRPGI